MPIKKQNFIKVSGFFFIALIMFIITWIGGYISWNIGIDRLYNNSQQQLEQFVSHLDARLARFQFFPQLITKNQLLVELLKQPQNTPRINLVNHFLEEINTLIGASDTYLMDANGLTLAASNWQSEQTFTNINFSFRPYFIEAMQGKLGRYFALGTTSGKRGYYFAYPIIYAAQNLGVIVVKMDLSNIELYWSRRKSQFIVSDPQGIVFITTKPEWLYHSIKPLSKETRKQITISQRYSHIDIKHLEIDVLRSISLDSSILKVNTINKNKKTKNNEYLSIKKNMPQAGWDVTILAPLSEVREIRIITLIVLFLMIALLLLIGFLAWQRHKRQLERERFQHEAQKQLEHQVLVRTTDLTHEIEEHKHTEKILRETQDELIQTAKLAVLGQMSASISHELNNPLAAIHSYADNARKFLRLENSTQVDDNLYRITQLTERMSKISSQLKFFSRKSINSMEVVAIHNIIQSATDIVSTQYKDSSSKIHIQNHFSELKALADIIQLEQILINLINNAMQAIENQNQGKIIIHSGQENNCALIHIDDNGPGIDEKDFEKIFEPFFTTKKTGLGLGLSISARIMNGMKGKLFATNLATGGARFTISLLVSE
jgi:two-component system, NtrC family, C4-dicarboxylate transport sensor histidine kinase DctB